MVHWNSYFLMELYTYLMHSMYNLRVVTNGYG